MCFCTNLILLFFFLFLVFRLNLLWNSIEKMQTLWKLSIKTNSSYCWCVLQKIKFINSCSYVVFELIISFFDLKFLHPNRFLELCFENFPKSKCSLVMRFPIVGGFCFEHFPKSKCSSWFLLLCGFFLKFSKKSKWHNDGFLLLMCFETFFV